MNDNITISIDGKKIAGWLELEVSLGLDQLSPTFTMSYTDKFFANTKRDATFTMGKECIIMLGDDRLATGHIEEIDSSYTPTDYTLQVRGRDNLGDLVDCAYWKPGYKNQWSGQTVESLISILCEPFQIDVVIDSSVSSLSTKRVSNFKINEGDTIADSIARLSRLYTFLPVGYGDGKLTLTKVGSDITSSNLKTGENIITGELIQSDVERFSNYIVKGQSEGASLKDLLSVTQPKADQAEDTLITRHRPLVILADGQVDSGICQEIAKWEALVRAGKSRQYRYTVRGWQQADGERWKINTLVPVNDNINYVSDTLLISRINYSLSEQAGKTTTLILMDKRTYEAGARPEQIKSKNDGSLAELLKGI
jgi:prophage tail gpP-like protein